MYYETPKLFSKKTQTMSNCVGGSQAGGGRDNVNVQCWTTGNSATKGDVESCTNTGSQDGHNWFETCNQGSVQSAETRSCRTGFTPDTE